MFVPSCVYDNGLLLFALVELMRTFSVLFVTCQATAPRIVKFGWSIPAVTSRLLKMKALMRSGRKTGEPVSGCSVEPHTFLGTQSCGVIDVIAPRLYAESSSTDKSSSAVVVKSVL